MRTAAARGHETYQPSLRHAWLAILLGRDRRQGGRALLVAVQQLTPSGLSSTMNWQHRRCGYREERRLACLWSAARASEKRLGMSIVKRDGASAPPESTL